MIPIGLNLFVVDVYRRLLAARVNLKNALNIQQLELFLCWSRCPGPFPQSHQHISSIRAVLHTNGAPTLHVVGSSD